MSKSNKGPKSMSDLFDMNKVTVAEGGHQISGIPVKSVKDKSKRVRKPKPAATATLNGAVEVLREWAEWSGAQGRLAAEAKKYFARRCQAGFTNPGQVILNAANGDTYEVLEQFNGSSTKVKTQDGRVTTIAPSTEVERVPTDEARKFEPKAVKVTKTPTVKVENKKVANEFNIPVEVTDKGHVKVFGQGACNLLYWAGSQGWDGDDVENLKVGLGLDRLAAENSIKNGLKIGAKSPEEYAKKFFTDEQEKALETAAGLRSVEEVKVEVKPKTITKKDLKRVGK